MKVQARLEPFGKVLLQTAIPTSFMGKVQLIQRLVRTLEQNGCVAGEAKYLAEICLDEALNNAIQHGNRGDPRKKISAVIFADETRWGAIISDEGQGFNPRQIPDPRRDENLLREGGRGITLIENYVDELIYSEKGNQVMLVKARAVDRQDLIP